MAYAPHHVFDASTGTWSDVPLTPEEVAARDQEAADNVTAKAAAAVLDGNCDTIEAAINTRLAKIRTARTALAAGNIFAALSVNEKAVIDGLLEDDLYLGRMVLELFDGTA